MSVVYTVYTTTTTTTSTTIIKSIGKNLKHPNNNSDTCVGYKRRPRRENENDKAILYYIIMMIKYYKIGRFL